MNVKHWALFFIVTLSVNYVSATFLPVVHSERSEYYDCTEHVRGFLSSKLDVFRKSFVSKYGNRCSLGNRELDNYSLRNVRAEGFHNFRLGDRCQCNVVDNQAFIRFSISFDEIVAYFFLEIAQDAEGILGHFAVTILDIIGHLANKILQIVFPSFLCDIEVRGDYDNGFNLSGFKIRKPEGHIGFRGCLADYGDRLSSFALYIHNPLEYIINYFLNFHFKIFLSSGIKSWPHNENVFSSLGLDLEDSSEFGGDSEYGGHQSHGDLGYRGHQSDGDYGYGGHQSDGESGEVENRNCKCRDEDDD